MTTIPGIPPGDGLVLFTPGDEFVGVEVHDLLPRLRLDPAIDVLDLSQTDLTVWVDGDEVDVDPDTAIGPGERLFDADDGNLFGYVIDRCGEWLHEWAQDAANRYIKINPDVPLRSQVSDIVDGSGFDAIFDENTEQTWTLPE